MSQLDEALDSIRSGEHDALIGVLEDEQLEFKGSPYQLSGDVPKLELAKDVSALANSSGGVILIGVRTKRGEGHAFDIAEGIRPFTRALVDVERYHNVISNWIYPAPRNVEITWWPGKADSTKGLVTILIPAQPPEARPFLVTRSLTESGKVSTQVFGYAERVRANATPLGVHELQALMRDGMRAHELAGEFESIRKDLREIKKLEERKLAVPFPKSEIPSRLQAAKKAARFDGAPSMALVHHPDEIVEVPGLLLGGSTAIVELMNNPPQLRPKGFNLAFRREHELVDGKARRLVLPKSRVLEVWDDGAVLYVLSKDDMCWSGKHDSLEYSNPIRKIRLLKINPVALVESIYLFALFAQELRNHCATTCPNFLYSLVFHGLKASSRTVGLTPGNVKSLGWQAAAGFEAAKSDSAEFSIKAPADCAPEEVAAAILEQIYAWFGFSRAEIPYVRQAEGTLVIDPDSLSST